MGFGEWILDSEWHRDAQTGKLRYEMDAVKRQLRRRREASRTVERSLEELQHENDELKLYLASVLRLLVGKGIATDEEIRAMVAAVDGEDGTEDGRYTGPMPPEG